MTQTPILDPVYEKLRQWVAMTCGDATCSFSVHSGEGVGEQGKPQVTTCLIEVLRTPVARSERLAPLQMNLRFLVCAWAERVEVAHEILLQLAFAAMEQEGWELEFEAPPPHVWNAFGIPLRPGFILRVPLRMDRVELRANPVRSVNLIGSPIKALLTSLED
jgi:hypothetical protein